MVRIFDIIANLLIRMAKALHISYNMANIIVYYFAVPLSWAIMLDSYFKMPILSIIIIAVWLFLIIRYKNNFSVFCDNLFDKSVQFLLSFRKIGWNYVVSSVIICVIIPLIIYIVLIFLLL